MVSIMSISTQQSTHEKIKEVVLAHSSQYRLSGQFLNSVDALAIAKEQKPDVVFIRNPMSFVGMEDFIRALTVKGIYCAFVVMELDSQFMVPDTGTGFNRQIVGRLREDELTAEQIYVQLEKIRATLVHNSAGDKSVETFSYAPISYEIASWLRENQFFGSLINSQLEPSYREKLPPFLRCTQGYLVMLVPRTKERNSPFSLWHNIEPIRRVLLTGQVQFQKYQGHHIFTFHDQKLCFWIQTNGSMAELLQEIRQLKENVQSSIAREEIAGFTACCTENPVALWELSKAYRSLDSLSKYHFFVDDEIILYSNWLTEHTVTPASEQIQYHYHGMIQSFQAFNRTAFYGAVEYLFQFVEKSLSFNTYYFIWNQLTFWYHSVLQEESFPNETISAVFDHNRYQKLSEAKEQMVFQLLKLFDKTKREEMPLQNPHISQALFFCESHILDEFTLTDVANAVGLSASYLSHLFQKELGKTFVEVRMAQKIEHAKTLLGQRKVYEVAQILKFSDEKYFSRSFKKVTGLSPKAYQMSLKKEV